MKTSVPVVILLVALSAACNQAAADLTTPAARGSYAQGVAIGEQGQQLPLDVEAFIAGIRDGLAGQGRLDAQEMQQAMMEFSGLVSEAMNAQAATALEAGEAFLADNGRREGVTTTASGLQYEVLRQGDGARPGPDDRVVVHYRGQTTDGEVFDESYARGEPTMFGVDDVIPGFSEGLQLMQVGSHYKFFIPGPLGYGASPPPGGAIGPNDTLIFEVELFRIE